MKNQSIRVYAERDKGNEREDGHVAGPGARHKPQERQLAVRRLERANGGQVDEGATIGGCGGENRQLLVRVEGAIGARAHVAECDRVGAHDRVSEVDFQKLKLGSAIETTHPIAKSYSVARTR